VRLLYALVRDTLTVLIPTLLMIYILAEWLV
jgi:hypothetical protein